MAGRADTRRVALSLADSLDLPAADGTIEMVRTCDPTRSRDGLVETLADGVAFHNADMSVEEFIELLGESGIDAVDYSPDELEAEVETAG